MADQALYNQILSNPADYNGEIIAGLIQQYPYAQSLRIIQAQKQHEAAAANPFDEALLYTHNPLWLYEQVTEVKAETAPPAETADEEEASYHPGEQPHAAIDEQEEIALQLMREDQSGSLQDGAAFGIDDPEAQAADEMLREEVPALAAPEVPDQQIDSDNGTDEEPTEASVTADPLLPDHPVSVDYLAYEQLTDEEPPAETADDRQGGRLDIVPASQGTPHEKVSLYDDEHMPYSFLWWLNKTRMEYAHTYQPYASDPSAATAHAGEEQVLDQQIRENIFHLQSPEEKLSDPYKANTIPFKVPQKTDPVIERFIREEPQIKPPQPEKINLENKARQSAEDQLTLVTETLAKIYEDQGLYPKAIAIYKKLSLKYPEKSAYFAALITTLENKLT
ncbi:hypothetical protein [Parapedobacter lycopersici]|uniref:hypothetical protein n=1 Tax=Parapedobacter lycopersici TaxID=1864939 RepID=UPI00214D816F|nr:hypothetical protein [Parapedobacter lycopersici]